MTMDTVVELGRKTLELTLLLVAPVLIVAMLSSLVINIVQVLTSIQDATVSTVPKLAVVAGTIFVSMPWILRKLVGFTLALFSDLRPYVH